MPLKNAVRMIPGSLVHWSIGPRSIPNVRTGESNRDRIQTPPPDNQNRPGVSAVRVDSVPHGWVNCVVSTAWKGEYRTRGEGYTVLLIRTLYPSPRVRCSPFQAVDTTHFSHP